VHQSTTARPLAGPALHIASHESIDAGELPPAFGSGFYQTVQFRLTSLGLAVQRPAQDLAFDQEGHLTSGAVVEVGSYATNVVWSPLIRAESATIIGHDEDGFAVVHLDAVDVATKSASIRANYPRRVLAGIVVTLVSLSAVVVAVAWEILKVRRRLLVARRAVPSAQMTGADAALRCSATE
jgi:hypothetical protein